MTIRRLCAFAGEPGPPFPKQLLAAIDDKQLLWQIIQRRDPAPPTGGGEHALRKWEVKTTITQTITRTMALKANCHRNNYPNNCRQ